MTKVMTLLCASLCAMAFVIAANPAHATGINAFSYVSNSGSDGNNCSNPTTDACATFNRALNETANYGEIDCVNTDFYQWDFTISQSVTIDCAGTVGSTNGFITINGTGIVVRLRNLSFNINGYARVGIDAQNMVALYVENCVISNYNDATGINLAPYLGIKFEPSSNAQLFVSNSVISNNGYSGSGITGGIYIVPGGKATATVSIDRSEINGNYFGIVGDGRSGGTISALIKDSVVSGNTENGLTAISSGSSVVFMIDQTAVSGNLAGLFASGSNTGILARNTTVFGNAIGLDAVNGGTLYTYGNNSVNGNTTNGAFTGTVSLQ